MTDKKTTSPFGMLHDIQCEIDKAGKAVNTAYAETYNLRQGIDSGWVHIVDDESREEVLKRLDNVIDILKSISN